MAATKTKLEIVVGSKNPVKFNACKIGFEEAFAALESIEGYDLSFQGVDAPSGVPDQPMGDEQTQEGAVNRAKAAYAQYAQEHSHNPDFAVGLEGGVQTVGGKDLECFAWIVIYNGKSFGYARTASFRLPHVITKLVNEGMELGDADDTVFNTVNSKQKGGTVGKLTRGVIDRTKYYSPAVVLALVPFLWSELYEEPVP